MGYGNGPTYSRTLEAGLVLDQITIDLEECVGSTCSTVTSTVDISLQPRGDCPEDFNGWFPTFPVDDLSLLSDVEPPARLIGLVAEPLGVFRAPYWQNDLQVRLPIDATLVEVYKRIAYSNLEDRNPGHGLEMQYGLIFETDCEGVWFKFGHLLELATDLVPYFDGVPTSEHTTQTKVGPLSMSEGNLVATKIGFSLDGNAFFSFGIHDDFGRVPTAQNPEQKNVACYYDFFPAETAEVLRDMTSHRSPVEEGVCPPTTTTP